MTTYVCSECDSRPAVIWNDGDGERSSCCGAPLIHDDA